MDKVMVTLLLMVAGVVCSLVLLNAVYPAITSSSGAIVDASAKIDDRIRSSIAIIEMSHSGNDAYIWIKNVGTAPISWISNSDVFFGPEGNFARIPYGGTVAPYWTYTIENDTRWGPSATLKLTIYYTSIASGEYYFKFTIPNGISAQDYYSVP
jgi:hypothetical protein